MSLSVVFKHTCGWEVGRWQRRQRAVGWREGGDFSPLGDKKMRKVIAVGGRTTMQTEIYVGTIGVYTLCRGDLLS